jgi:hypothetical protein
MQTQMPNLLAGAHLRADRSFNFGQHYINAVSGLRHSSNRQALRTA